MPILRRDSGVDRLDRLSLLSRRGQILYRTAKEIPQSLVFLFPDQRVGNERQALAFDELAEVE